MFAGHEVEQGEHVHVRSVREIKQAGLRLAGTKSRNWMTCPHPSGTNNQVGGHSSIHYEVARKAGLSLSVRYEESSRPDFVRLVRSHTKGELVIVRSV